MEHNPSFLALKTYLLKKWIFLKIKNIPTKYGDTKRAHFSWQKNTFPSSLYKTLSINHVSDVTLLLLLQRGWGPLFPTLLLLVTLGGGGVRIVLNTVVRRASRVCDYEDWNLYATVLLPDPCYFSPIAIYWAQ